jgi:hypothetical protein
MKWSKRPYGNEYTLEYIAIAEKALGKPLPYNAVIHHLDGNRSNAAKTNLVICENQGYHMLLHQRERALKQSGNADFKKCVYCKIYDHPRNLREVHPKPNWSAFRHAECHARYMRNKKKQKGA